jgi:hypothetical protein
VSKETSRTKMSISQSAGPNGWYTGRPQPQQRRNDHHGYGRIGWLGKSTTICPLFTTRAIKWNEPNWSFSRTVISFDKDALSSTLQSVHWSNAVIIFDGSAQYLESFASDKPRSNGPKTLTFYPTVLLKSIRARAGALSIAIGRTRISKKLHLLKWILSATAQRDARDARDIQAHELVKMNDWMAD